MIPESNEWDRTKIKTELESRLEVLPGQCSEAKLKWQNLRRDRKRIEAKLYLQFKHESEKRTAPEIRAMVQSDNMAYQAGLDEDVAEAEYNLLIERLRVAKGEQRL